MVITNSPLVVTYFNETKSNYSLKSEGGEVRVHSATYKNEGTFYNSHFKTIEQKTDKFHEITQTSSTGVFQIESEGQHKIKLRVVDMITLKVISLPMLMENFLRMLQDTSIASKVVNTKI